MSGIEEKTEESKNKSDDLALEMRIKLTLVMGAFLALFSVPFFLMLATIRDYKEEVSERLFLMSGLVLLYLVFFFVFSHMLCWLEYDEKTLRVKRCGFRNKIQMYEISFKDIESVRMRMKSCRPRHSVNTYWYEDWTIMVRKEDGRLKKYKRVPIEDLSEMKADFIQKMRSANEGIKWDIPREYEFFLKKP